MRLFLLFHIEIDFYHKSLSRPLNSLGMSIPADCFVNISCAASSDLWIPYPQIVLSSMNLICIADCECCHLGWRRVCSVQDKYSSR